MRKEGFFYMGKVRKLISMLMVIAVLLSCIMTLEVGQAIAGAGNDDSVLHAATVNEIDVDSEAYKSVDENILFNQLFDINNKVEINIDMPQKQLALMQADYEKYNSMGSKSPINRKADLYITITNKSDGSVNKYTIKQVGVKMKGNTSRTSFYSSSKGIYNLVHLKIDFQEKFDDEAYYTSDELVDWSADKDGKKARKKRTFAGMKKLELKWNRNHDQTYIRDYYTNELYRANGIYSAHTNIASTDFGGTHVGVYTIYEPIDKVFIEKYLPVEEQGGDLYKCGWDNSQGASFTKGVSIGIEDEDKCLFYCYDKKTNKDADAITGLVDHTPLNNLINQLSGSVTKTKLASLVDMDYFIKYAAVSYFCGNPDDLRNNYNNYFVYFKKNDNKAIIIPYDNDRTLGVSNGWNPSSDAMTGVSPYSSKAVGRGEEQINPLFKYSVCKNGFYVSEYEAALAKVAANNYLTTAKFNSVYEIAKANYSSLAKPSKNFEKASNDKFAFNNTVSASLDSSSDNVSFSNYLKAIKKTYNESKDSLGEDSYYVVGTMNDWNTSTGKKMKKNANGTYSYTFAKLKGAEYRFKVVRNAPEEGWQDDNNWGGPVGDAVNSQGKNWEYEKLTVTFNPVTKTVTSKAVNVECLQSPTGSHKYSKTTVKATTAKDGYYLEKCSACGKSKRTTIYKASNVKLGSTNYIYNGKSQSVKVSVKDSKGKAISSSYYTLSYPTGKTTYGKHTVVVKFKGIYSGQKTLSFMIRPNNTSFTKILRGPKRLTFTWKKPKYSVSGYQIQYSKNSNFSGAKYVKLSNKTYTKRISSLAGDKKYYFRIRTYKKLSNGTYVYSMWSSTQSAKTLRS